MKNFSKILFLIIVSLLSCSRDDLNFYEVKISSAKGGKVEGLYLESEVIEGQSITLTAVPSNENYQNYIFTGWSGTLSSTENPLNIVVSKNISITANFRLENYWEDELYSQFDSNPESFVKVFIADAKRHGVDLSHVNLETIEIEIRENGLIAYSAASCDPNNVRIGIRKDLWELQKDMFNTEWKFRWLVGIIYHELGHDLLKLRHLCAGGHIMTGNHQSPQGECNGREENLYNLKYNNEDLVINWQRALEDMFTGKGQVYRECNNNSNKSEKIIKEIHF
jgi:uncharacterized repeat protein (TIGR02543 family)